MVMNLRVGGGGGRIGRFGQSLGTGSFASAPDTLFALQTLGGCIATPCPEGVCLDRQYGQDHDSSFAA